MANFYDFDTINREVPIEDVLAFHGIYPNSKGNYSIRPEDDTPSASIDKNRRFGNTIHDFGDNNTFNPISLTMYVQNVGAVEAARVLGDAFGIAPIRKDKSNPDVLSDWEWCKIGVQPDMASKNMDFFPEKYGTDRTREYAEKYRMPINELKKQDVPMYERIVRSRAIPYVLDLKNTYYSRLYNWDAFNKKCNLNPSMDSLYNDKEINGLAKDLSLAESILEKAIKGTSITFKTGAYNVKTDFYKVINGKISFEVGKDSHYDIKCAAYQDKVKPYYCLVPVDEYYKLVVNGLDNIRYAAFQKGNEVNLAFLPADSDQVKFLLKALRGKEIGLTQNLGVEQDKEKEPVSKHVQVDKPDFQKENEKEYPD